MLSCHAKIFPAATIALSLTAGYVTAFITGFGVTVEKLAKIHTGRKL